MGNKRRKVHINRVKFKLAYIFKDRTLVDLCKETGLNYDTTRQCLSQESIMPDDLQLLCDTLGINPAEVME